MVTNRLRKKMKKKIMNKDKQTTQEIQKSMMEALQKYLKDKNSAKEFSLCMKESSQWLKEKEK